MKGRHQLPLSSPIDSWTLAGPCCLSEAVGSRRSIQSIWRTTVLAASFRPLDPQVAWYWGT